HEASGGMGSVYRARDLESGATVALKVLDHDDNALVKRFMREAEVLSELKHPGIVRHIAHGASSSPGRAFWLAMEWLDGHDLRAHLDRGPMPVRDALVLGAHVADALGAAHARGLVHRDIKPSNLFLVDGHIDDPHILDFGVAKVASGLSLTRSGQTVG